MKERIDNLRELTSKTLEEIRRLALGLHPIVLDDFGLKVAIERYCREYTRVYNISVETHLNRLGSHRLPKELETNLFRILQEALTNIAKHADAQEVRILVQIRHKSVRMIIKDNGKGFAVANSMATPGQKSQLGLHGMRERASLFGGSIVFESSSGSGTSVNVEIPLPTGITQ